MGTLYGTAFGRPKQISFTYMGCRGRHPLRKKYVVYGTVCGRPKQTSFTYYGMSRTPSPTEKICGVRDGLWTSQANFIYLLWDVEDAIPYGKICGVRDGLRMSQANFHLLIMGCRGRHPLRKKYVVYGTASGRPKDELASP